MLMPFLPALSQSRLTFSTITDQPTNIRQYVFSYPDGSKLISLWINDIAAEVDPQVQSVITIPGVTASRVVGIDPMYGYEQERLTLRSSMVI